MTKQIFLLLVLSTNSFLSFSQDKKYINEDYDIHHFRTIRIRLSYPSTHYHLRNIQSVSIIDARPDSLAVGFMQKHPSNHAFLKFDQSVGEEIKNFVSNYLSLQNEDLSNQLVIVIKKLWLSDEIAKDTYKLNEIVDDKKEWTSGVIVKMELYFKHLEDYYPLYRYDSVIRSEYIISEYNDHLLGIALSSSLARLIEIDSLNSLTRKHVLTWPQIKQYNDDSYKIPILEDSMLKEGAYKTFEEFKNNNPSIKQYRIEKDKKNDMFYIKDASGKETPTRDVWGYCAEQKIFIKQANNYFLLQRSENALYFYGAKYVNFRSSSTLNPPNSDTTGNSTFNNNSQSYYTPYDDLKMFSPGMNSYDQFYKKNYRLVLKPFVIDWDSGDVY